MTLWLRQAGASLNWFIMIALGWAFFVNTIIEMAHAKGEAIYFFQSDGFHTIQARNSRIPDSTKQFEAEFSHMNICGEYVSINSHSQNIQSETSCFKIMCITRIN